jgi:ApbE superfamily uncharacterized protein (UPF0280 family)
MAGVMQAMLIGRAQRLHLQHGPIDLIIEAETGQEPTARTALFETAYQAAAPLLEGLVAELPGLRAAYDPAGHFNGPVACRMQAAAAIAGPVFITPMAAVAGAVADQVLAAMLASKAARFARKIWVNNGGDIAFYAARDGGLSAVLAGLPDARLRIPGGSGWAGMATSGRGGRSHSLGIADSVTVLAGQAALADAAATLIANVVDLPGHPAIQRCPAHQLAPESDLGAREVVCSLGPLSDAERDTALQAGEREARRLLAGNPDIAGAVLSLGDKIRLVGLTQDSPASALKLAVPMRAGKTVTKPVEELSYA